MGRVALRFLGTVATLSTKRLQARQRVGLVLLQAAAGLGLDHHHAFGGDALVAQGQQAFTDRFGQRRAVDGEAQVHRVGHLVHVLPARALRPNGGELHFGFVDAVQGGALMP